jgi:hypothetical protein
MSPTHHSCADPYGKLMIYRKKPAKYPSLAKNPPKYTTTYIVQQSNCRWHCERSCFLRLGLNNEKSVFTPSLFNLSTFYLSLSNKWATRHPKKYNVPRTSQLRWSLRQIMVIRENPAQCPSLAKNPPKYTTACIVQQSNGRWHCEPSCFSSKA